MIGVWLEPEQATFVTDVVARLGASVAHAGASAPGRAAAVAQALSAQPFDDLREFLLSVGPRAGSAARGVTSSGSSESASAIDLLWIASAADIRFAEDPSMLAAMRACIARGVPVLSSAAVPGSLFEFVSSQDPVLIAGPQDSGAAADAASVSAATLWPEMFPRFRLSGPFIDVASELESFGRTGAVHMQHVGSAVQASAGARLIDTLDTIAYLLGEPEDIYAAYAPAADAAPRHATAKLSAAAHGPSLQTVRALRGTLSATLRYSDGRGASLLVSDCAGLWSRTLTLLGDGSTDTGGRLTVTSTGIDWVDRAGAPLERRRPARRRGDIDRIGEATLAFADALSPIGRQQTRMHPPINHPMVLSMAGAAILSATTGEPESPSTIRRMIPSS